MTLPTPDEINWSEWKQYYKIDTPTFELTPVEKPDISPFLVHMTGENAIFSILNGENAPDHIGAIPPNHGYFRASTPDYNDATIIEFPVVCFTETPTFAIDFFRYRKFSRWRDDQRFGLGFDKRTLVMAGVRPVLYVDREVRRHLIFLWQQLEKNGGILASDSSINQRLVDLLQKVFPIAFPLLEDMPTQGFMWEREWRHPNPDGFIFSFDSIRIICCPENEEHRIRGVLGEVAGNIQFVRAWREYQDVTNFLRQREPVWQAQTTRVQATNSPEETASRLENLISQLKIALHSLESYQNYIEYLNAEMQQVADEKDRLSQEIGSLESQLAQVKRTLEEKQGEDQKAVDDTNNGPDF